VVFVHKSTDAWEAAFSVKPRQIVNSLAGNG
jgi:hypothetical protein